MQCRLNHIKISEVPKFLMNDPDKFSHAVVVEDLSGDQDPLIILLLINGVTSYFPVQTPTTTEWEDNDVPRVDMTYESP